MTAVYRKVERPVWQKPKAKIWQKAVCVNRTKQSQFQKKRNGPSWIIREKSKRSRESTAEIKPPRLYIHEKIEFKNSTYISYYYNVDLFSGGIHCATATFCCMQETYLSKVKEQTFSFLKQVWTIRKHSCKSVVDTSCYHLV